MWLRLYPAPACHQDRQSGLPKGWTMDRLSMIAINLQADRVRSPFLGSVTCTIGRVCEICAAIAIEAQIAPDLFRSSSIHVRDPSAE